MTTENLNLIQAMYRKIGWTEERQKIIAQNIANADTPGYRPQDLTKADFKDLLGSSTSSVSLNAPKLAATDSAHVGGQTSGVDLKADQKPQKKTYEVAPAGNAVVLEEQLLKLNENMTEHRFITNLYQKNIDMLKASLK